MTTRWSALVAVAGTASTGAAAAVLSFAALGDLAARSGVAVPALWPAIVDGVVIVATVAVVAGAGRYAWGLLVVGALVSVAGNVVHAAIPDGVLPVWLRATVAAVPPVALVAVAHLAVRLRQTPASRPTIEADAVLQPDARSRVFGSQDCAASDPIELPVAATALVNGDTIATSGSGIAPRSGDDDRSRALELLATGTSPRAVADQFGVHRATIYRWKRSINLTEKELHDEAATQ